MTKIQTKAKTSTGLEVEVRKDFYLGLWNIWYVEGTGKYDGPFKTKREAIERLRELTQ
jgi:hypothetical protein